MVVSSVWRFALVCTVLAAAAPIAEAQNVTLDAPGLLVPKKGPPPPAPRAPPTVWPRLDPGAVLCKTEDDLARHASNMTARVSGGSAIPADCRIIGAPVGVQIVSRQGPGSTQVKLNGGGNVTGWTDVWLPDRPPGGR